MADEPNFTEITIRHKTTGEERQIAKHALPFWPEWEQANSQDSRAAASKSTNEKKES